MFSPDELKRKFYPGQEWLYLKAYMGPETVEEWLCYHFPVMLNDLHTSIGPLSYHFVRYLDPDFHLRLRFHLAHHGDFARALDVFNMHSSLFMKQGLIWKVELATYEREIERYGSKRIVMFEQAFHIDSNFWISILPWLGIQEDREELRWKIALLSLSQYYSELLGDQEKCFQVVSKVCQALKKEQKINKTLQFQIDQKFRNLRAELTVIINDGFQHEPMIEAKLQNRTYLLTELFEGLRVNNCYFNGSRAEQQFIDLVHMSTNRVLRARHRMQEYVLYYFYSRLLKTQLALA